MVTQALLALPEPQVPLDPTDPSAPPANRETEERRVPKDLLDPPDLLEPEAWLDPKDLAETRERPVRVARGDRRVTEDSPVCRVCPDLPVRLVTRVLLDLPDLLDQEDPLDQLVHLERTVPMDSLAPSDPPDLVDVLARLVPLVLPVTPDPLVLPVPQALASTCLPSPASASPRRPPIP